MKLAAGSVAGIIRVFVCAALIAALLGGCAGEQAAEPYSMPPASEFSSAIDERVFVNPAEPGVENKFPAYRYTGQYGGLPFRLYMPPDYSEEEGPLPLLVFLHGLGDRGDDNTSQLSDATPYPVLIPDDAPQPYRCMILAPQCSEKTMWYGLGPVETTVSLVEQMSEALPVDKNRIYLMGISMGGMGIYSMLNRQPDLFAAAVPICGEPVIFGIARTISGIPIWAFHAADDDVVSVRGTRELMGELEALGAPVKYTEFELGGHAIWHEVFGAPEVFAWLFAQSR